MIRLLLITVGEVVFGLVAVGGVGMVALIAYDWRCQRRERAKT